MGASKGLPLFLCYISKLNPPICTISFPSNILLSDFSFTRTTPFSWASIDAVSASTSVFPLAT